MTFDGYINNPMGVKNSVISNREMYRALYTDKLNKILVREVGKIKYTLYRLGEKYLIHMKVPSEVVDKFYYDVIIEFYTDKKELLASRTLNSYDVKFYSNDPSFVFTFAHAFVKNDLFIKELSSKMSKEAIKKTATEKNPKDEVGYVKSLYFAYLLIKNYGLFNKIAYDTNSLKLDWKDLASKIEDADKKIHDRQTAGEEVRKKKTIDKKKETSQAIQQNRDRYKDEFTTKSSNNIKSTPIVKQTKRTSTTKRTKKI